MRATITAVIIALSILALSACDEAVEPVNPGVAVEIDGCHVGADVDSETVTLEVRHPAGVGVAVFESGELVSGAEVVGDGATLERHVNLWCTAESGVGGLECLGVIWRVQYCWQ